MRCFRKGKTVKTVQEIEEEETNKIINKEISENKVEQRVSKLLLLGTGDSGKSTFHKQMLSLYTKEAQLPEYYQSYALVLRMNCLNGMQSLLKFFKEVGIQQSPADTDVILQAATLTPKVAKSIQNIWSSPDFRVLAEKSECDVQLDGGIHGASYFFDNAVRFAEPDYKPTFTDILKSRRKTTGINESSFLVGNKKYLMIDVGGQRSERKKWLNCFSEVSCILFFAAINEYDLVLEEDTNVNRLVESLKLWKVLSMSPYFKYTPFVLFLNKSDLFQEKVKTAPLIEIFKDFAEFSQNPEIAKLDIFEQSWRYILLQYERHFRASVLFSHLTCAIDTNNCKMVFQDIQEALYEQAERETIF